MRRLPLLLGALGALLGIVPLSAPAAQAATPPALPTAARFWMVEPDGHVWNFGGAAPKGTLAGVGLTQPLVATETTSDGFYALASDGGVFTFGNAKFFGSTGALRLNRPIVGMALTPTGQGYWLVASDGGVFSFGDARFFGSTGSLRLNQPVVGMTSTPTGKGYWLVASDGGVFSFGDARFFGSTGSLTLNQPITSITRASDGRGYWMLARDGGIFTFGTAKFLGSAASSSSQSAQRLVRTSSGNGYWIMRENGELASFGDAVWGIPATQAVLWSPSTPGDRAVQFAFAQLGKPYIWGGNGPVGYDCSGLVLAAWRSVGRSFARVANDQYRSTGVPVAMNALEPGDLVFWGDNLDDWQSVYHAGMYVGGGQIVESTGDHVQLNRLRQWGTSDIMPVGRRP